MIELAIALSVLSICATGVVAFLLLKVNNQLEQLSQNAETLSKTTARLEMQIDKLKTASQAQKPTQTDPISLVLGLVPAVSQHKWFPVVALVSREFATYLKKRNQKRSAEKALNVRENRIAGDLPQN